MEGAVSLFGSWEAAVTATPPNAPRCSSLHSQGSSCAREVLLSQGCNLSLRPLSITSHGQLLDTEDFLPGYQSESRAWT